MKIIQIILGAAFGSLIANLLREKFEHRNEISKKNLLSLLKTKREQIAALREANTAITREALAMQESVADRQRRNVR